MESSERIERAAETFREAYRAQMQGDLAHAVELYRRSIALHPTAEAHTFLGWTFSYLGRLEEAIAECRRAIQVDPDFGNPYNDIGAYLIERGEFRAAAPWLEKAIRAPRYECRHFAHYNLGRVREGIGDWPGALACYRRALAAEPDYTLARDALGRLVARAN